MRFKGAFIVPGAIQPYKSHGLISLLTYRFRDSRHIFQSWSSCYFYKQFLSEDTRWRRFFHLNHKLDYCCSDNPAWYTHKFVYSRHGSRNENMEQGRFCYRHWSLKIGKIEHKLGLLNRHHPLLLALVYRPSSYESRGTKCSKYSYFYHLWQAISDNYGSSLSYVVWIASAQDLRLLYDKQWLALTMARL